MTLFRKATAFVLFLALLVPSAWYAWSNRDMPQLGRSHDDAIYYTVAKSVAEGTGYRIQNLPEAPYETKYPPLLIWLLSATWLIEPHFHANLPWATLVGWIMIPPFLFLAWVWFGKAGLEGWRRWLGLAILALGPYTVSFGVGVHTEVMFGVLLLGSLLACDKAIGDSCPGDNCFPHAKCVRHSWRWAAAGGILAGLAYLTRTAGIVAVVAMPGVLLFMKKRREAMAFAAAMLPFIAGWMVWVKLHHVPPTDLVTLYNTDYLGFLLEGLRPSDMGVLLWKNFGHLLYEIGGLAFPLEAESMLLEMLRTTVAAGIILGLWRRRENRLVQMYAAFAAVTTVELLVWNFPPNLRLMYSFVPLLVAGLVWEVEHFAVMLRGAFAHPERSQRVAGWMVGGAAGSLALMGVWMTWTMTFQVLPDQAKESVVVRGESEAAFAWIAEHSAADANVLCLNPALYLYTARHTETLVSLPIYWYRSDSNGVLAPIRELPAHASAHPMRFIYLHEFDYDAFAPGSGDEARKLVEANPGLKPVFRSGRGVVYELLSSKLQVRDAARR
ncbi:MAG: hypothetical protein ABI824_08540 [Acidobacteriota bacterium]